MKSEGEIAYLKEGQGILKEGKSLKRHAEEELGQEHQKEQKVKEDFHVAVWRNKTDLDKISIDNLYNNFKIIEQEVKRNAGQTSSSGSQNMAFISTSSTSNNVDVSTVFEVSTASSQVSTANLSDATVYVFLANQPNRSQLVHEDLEQIHEDDMKRKTVNVEDTYSKAIVAIDGVGFDWSYMADDEAPTNIAFMAFLDSETSSVKISKPFKENNDAPLIEDWESKGEDKVESPPEIEKETVKPCVDKRERMVNGTNHSRVNHSANTVPKAVLTRTGLKPVNTIRLDNSK
nr:hypothetical protein [Tanacetum cinerariifolium]